MQDFTRVQRAGGQVIAVLALMAAVIFAVTLAGVSARKYKLEQMNETAALQAERHAVQLETELGRFDHLPDVIRFHPAIQALLDDPKSPQKVEAANRYLESVNAVSGSGVLYVLDLEGICIAASNWRDKTSFVGVDLSYRPYFREALKSSAQHFFGIGTTTGVPGYFASRAIPSLLEPKGVGVVKVEKWHAASWPGAGRMMIVDGNGVIVLSSQEEWKYHTIAPLPDAVLERIRAERQYENVPLRPLGFRHVETLGPASQLLDLPLEDGGVPVLAVERLLSGSDWKVVVLLDLTDLGLFRYWVQIVVALTASTLALLVLYLWQRRRAENIERAATTALARANLELEREVENRTHDLIEANKQLRNTQDELVHSAKLAAIGQIAAGVTHELNQPMAAIRSLADNANVFLDRGQNESARENLKFISDLVDRMSGITNQLKVFARKRPAQLAAVPLMQTLSDSLFLLDERIRRIQARVIWDRSGEEIYVRADRDRLGQVLVNVISNALDAMAQTPHPQIRIEISDMLEGVAVSIRDTGPGLAPGVIQRVFEPFFTTKLAGSGLGLGLAISERIMRDFGGTMRAENAQEGGGALFLLHLRRAQAALAEAG